MNDFQTALNKKTSTLESIWTVVSGLCLWLNETEMCPFLDKLWASAMVSVADCAKGCDDGDRVKELTKDVGALLLCTLAAIDHTRELKPDGRLLDVPVVMTSFLEWSAEFEACGWDYEGDLEWRPPVVAYFKKGKYDASQGISTAQKRLDEVEEVYEGELAPASNKDPWDWKKKLQAYKIKHSVAGGRVPKIGGTHYDITRISRAQREAYAFDHVDPLKDVSDKDLKEGNLVLG